MSEPVGNTPRSSLQGNSHKSRETESPIVPAKISPPETPEKIESVVEGKVVIKKPGLFKRLSSKVIADDAQSVGGHILDNILIPAIRNLVVDSISQGAEQVFLGSPRRGGGGRTVINGSSVRNSYRNMPTESRGMDRSARARHDFEQITLESRTEAIRVLEDLVNLNVRFGRVRVSDLYDLLGVTGSYADQGWGWTDLSTADVRPVRGGVYRLDLPQPEPLR